MTLNRYPKPSIVRAREIIAYRSDVGDRISRFCNHPKNWYKAMPLHEENTRRMLKEIEEIKRC